MLARLLHIANTSPANPVEFYAMKARILQRFGRRSALVLQTFPAKPCWGCEGSGVWYHSFSGDPDECSRCGGTGNYCDPLYVTLQRWRLGKFTFYEPIDRENIRPHWFTEALKTGEVVPSIEGRVTHARYSFRAVRRSTILLGLFFSWRLAWLEMNDAVSHWGVVKVATRRCWDCRRRLWSTRIAVCKGCQARRDRRHEHSETPF